MPPNVLVFYCLANEAIFDMRNIAFFTFKGLDALLLNTLTVARFQGTFLSLLGELLKIILKNQVNLMLIIFRLNTLQKRHKIPEIV